MADRFEAGLHCQRRWRGPGAAQKEQDLLAADVDLADQELQDNVDFVTSELPESAAESDAIQVEADGYQVATTANLGQDQIGTAEADQTQMLDLAEAASAYLVNAAKADKNEELNIINNVSNWKDLYKQDIADAKLTLTDEQADADQAWIEGKAMADDTFLIADAGAWQTMSDDEAGTTDLFANQDDADVWAENDAVAKNESDALKAEALADQKQGNSDAAAAASFQIAQANETATIWSWLDGQLGTPWADSQAGLAATEATWAVTAAANYQTYVAGLGTAEINYANDNAARFLTEIKAIDLADLTAGNDAADAAALLSTTLTDDEASFEEPTRRRAWAIRTPSVRPKTIIGKPKPRPITTWPSAARRPPTMRPWRPPKRRGRRATIWRMRILRRSWRR